MMRILNPLAHLRMEMGEHQAAIAPRIATLFSGELSGTRARFAACANWDCFRSAKRFQMPPVEAKIYLLGWLLPSVPISPASKEEYQTAYGT